MSAGFWQFVDDHFLGLFLFGLIVLGGVSNLIARAIRSMDPAEVQLARIEADKQVRLAQIEEGMDDD